MLKNSKANTDDQDNKRLREIINEMEKENKKMKEKRDTEISRLKN